MNVTLTGKRDLEIQKCIEVGCQFMVQNTHTDQPKVDTGLVNNAETPLSVGLPMTIYHRVHDRNLACVLSSVYLGY